MKFRDCKLLKFKEYCEGQNLDNMKFEVFDGAVHNFEFCEKAVELFLQYLGIPKIDYFIGV